VTGVESIAGSGDIRTHWVPRFQEKNLEKNLKVVNQFKTLADKKGCTPSQLAIAWVLKQGDDFIPIPGTKGPSIWWLIGHRSISNLVIGKKRRSVTSSATQNSPASKSILPHLRIPRRNVRKHLK
jgi:hypothetical protein